MVMGEAEGLYGSYQYKHSIFVSTDNGASSLEILILLSNIALTPLIAALLYPWIIPPAFSSLNERHLTNLSFFIVTKMLVEYPVVIVYPLLLVTTLAGGSDSNSLAGFNWVCFAFLFTLCFCLSLFVLNYTFSKPKWKGVSYHYSYFKNLSISWHEWKFSLDCGTNETVKPSKIKHAIEETEKSSQARFPFITNYKSLTTYITVVSILAVDFTVFPRRYAKTKSYGCSLMDIGTGCFVFANGISSPEAKQRNSDLLKSMRSSIPLIALGAVRFFFLKAAHYQEVVHEYGVHWNFFFTLAAVKLLSSVIFCHFGSSSSLRLGILMGTMYQIILSYYGLQDYILDEHICREKSFIDANREGLCSVFGYLTLYLCSVYVGHTVYNGDVKTTVGSWASYGVKSFVELILLWLIFAIVPIPVCRRSANITYVLWTLATNYTVLWIEFFISLTISCLQHVGLVHGPWICYQLRLYKKREDEKLLKNLKTKFSESIPLNKTKDETPRKRSSSIKKKIKKQLEATKKLKRLENDLRLVVRRFDTDLRPNEEKLNQLRRHIQQIEEKANGIQSDVSKKMIEYDSSSNEIPRQHISCSIPENNLFRFQDFSVAPIILESVCYNALLVFLVGNILTGLINSLVFTHYQSDSIGFAYLWSYATIITLVSVALYLFQIKFKFW